MPKIRRLFVVMILLSAALTGMVMGARWTGGDSDPGTAIELEKPAAQYTAVQAGAKEKPAQDSANSRDWTLYTGVLVLTGLYVTARITGVKKRGKKNDLG
jgi:hypothetical protein